MQDQTAGWAGGDVVPGVVADYAMELSCAVPDVLVLLATRADIAKPAVWSCMPERSINSHVGDPVGTWQTHP